MKKKNLYIILIFVVLCLSIVLYTTKLWLDDILTTQSGLAFYFPWVPIVSLLVILIILFILELLKENPKLGNKVSKLFKD